MRPELKALPPGSLVRLEGDDGTHFGVCFYNPHSLIAARRLDADPETAIDEAWLTRRLKEALALRTRFFPTPFYRLVHAEADRLPGLIVDRFGAIVVLQANSAGMECLLPELTGALQAVLSPEVILARNDGPQRTLEGLASEARILAGAFPAARTVEEGGLVFSFDPEAGQKTGWFYDQRESRDQITALAGGARVLDLFCHTGGFGLRARAAGAREVLLIDTSERALGLARESAARNGLTVDFRRADAFAAMSELGEAGERFDLVLCDPPPFIRTKKDQAAGLRAYEKMARLAARLVTPGGFLFAASCSYHAAPDAFFAAIGHGLARARRAGRIVRTGGAGPDHPIHPELPESAYLKTLLIQLF